MRLLRRGRLYRDDVLLLIGPCVIPNDLSLRGVYVWYGPLRRTRAQQTRRGMHRADRARRSLAGQE